MEVRHEFHTGVVVMEQIHLRLAGIEAETALAAIERAREDAWAVLSEFQAALNDAEALIRNTGSIYGNAMPGPVDISGSWALCRACSGSGVFPVYHADTDRAVFQTCPDCGGSRMHGPTIR